MVSLGIITDIALLSLTAQELMLQTKRDREKLGGLEKALTKTRQATMQEKIQRLKLTCPNCLSQGKSVEAIKMNKKFWQKLDLDRATEKPSRPRCRDNYGDYTKPIEYLFLMIVGLIMLQVLIFLNSPYLSLVNIIPNTYSIVAFIVCIIGICGFSIPLLCDYLWGDLIERQDRADKTYKRRLEIYNAKLQRYKEIFYCDSCHYLYDGRQKHYYADKAGFLKLINEYHTLNITMKHFPVIYVSEVRPPF